MKSSIVILSLTAACPLHAASPWAQFRGPDASGVAEAAKPPVVASPLAANSYIYVVNASGSFAVLRAGGTLDVAAVNKLDESVRTTLAIAGDTLYVRSGHHLWAFREKQSAKP